MADEELSSYELPDLQSEDELSDPIHLQPDEELSEPIELLPGPLEGAARKSDGERLWEKEARFRLTLTSGLILFTGFLTVAVMAVLIWGTDEHWRRVTTFGGNLISPWQTLLGLVVGYYFAEKRIK